MTETTAGANPEAERKLKSSFLVIYSKEDTKDFAKGVITELREYGFEVTDINDQIDQGVWSKNSDNIMQNSPAILVIPSAKMSEDGEIKTAVYQAITYKVEKKRRVVPILNATNAKQGPSSLRTAAGVNWDGKADIEFSVKKETAFGHLQIFLERNLDN